MSGDQHKRASQKHKGNDDKLLRQLRCAVRSVTREIGKPNEQRLEFEAEILFHHSSAIEKPEQVVMTVTGTLLHLAAYCGCETAVELALGRHADTDDVLDCISQRLSTTDMENTTPLYLAASRKHWNVVYRLIKAKARLGKSTFWAIHYELPEIFRRMISTQDEPLSRNDLFITFRYVVSGWTSIRKKNRMSEQSMVALTKIMLDRGVYHAFSKDQRNQCFEAALGKDDNQIALALAQAGFAEEFDIDNFLRVCLAPFPREKQGFETLLTILGVVVEKHCVDKKEFMASMDKWSARSEEQDRRASKLGVTLERSV
ncbi:hypothetical protein K4K59_004311 [Colletotrichum sp. SAR11_240]|nr:hypothetical protein K4K59_004311 [Colletotrichum sp. SAR11_240]